ncbi:allantoate deiminase 2 isoform X2 [Vigna angularis]|uniref:allantoate deiminase 2 isoform X2 n=1 Tax=Phaseolus angularis TaxID=3914 RepID=UPI0022B48DE0|nr:allantoate deiminase 2 isoform X2 [Vigna angularis]
MFSTTTTTTTFLHSCFLLSCLLSALSCVSMFSGIETGDLEKRDDLFPQILRDEAVARLYELGKVSDGKNYLERTFLSPASMRAISLIRRWMEDAGLRTWVDQMGNVHGRVEGANANAEALLIGSHMDTVVDAGMFDGSLGIVSAISALKAMHVNGKLEKLKRPVEVIAFSDEEGVRFQTTFLGSGAIAGILPATTLEISDKRDVMIKDFLKENSIDITEESLLKLKYDPKSVWGYVEVHIEQGPVLEQVGFPLGVVKGIAGQTRLKVTVRGSQGHAGTVPMSMRQDPMAAAAEQIVVLESLCKHPEEYLSYDAHCSDSTVKSLSSSLVCTVGEISTWPSASNVIPGQASHEFLKCADPGMSKLHIRLTYEQLMTLDVRLLSMICQNKFTKYVTSVQFPALLNTSMMQVL